MRGVDMGYKAQSFKNKDYIKNELGVSVSERWPKNDCPLHWHEFVEVELVLDGRARQILNGKEQILQRGSLTVIRHTDFHEISPEEGFHLINLSIEDGWIGEEMLLGLADKKELYFTLSPDATATLGGLLALVGAEASSEKPDRRYLKHLVLCLFLKILGLTPNDTSRKNEVSAPIQSALLYMKLHFRENPTLLEVAKVSHYNAGHFSTVFHREMGVTYSVYLNNLKLAYAKELLLTTDRKVTEICFESGFSSHSNFLRLFKEETGLSPAAYRKKHLAEKD